MKRERALHRESQPHEEIGCRRERGCRIMSEVAALERERCMGRGVAA
jgi:hypothetical protein